MSLSSSVSAMGSQKIFQEQLESISQRGWFNRYFIVENGNNGPILKQTNILTFLKEKFSGLVGGCDMTNKTLVELVTISFLEKNKNLISSEDIDKIQQLAERAGLQSKPGIAKKLGSLVGFFDANYVKEENIKKHKELGSFVSSITQHLLKASTERAQNPSKSSKDLVSGIQEDSSLKVSLVDGFVQSHSQELSRFSQIVNKVKELSTSFKKNVELVKDRAADQAGPPLTSQSQLIPGSLESSLFINPVTNPTDHFLPDAEQQNPPEVVTIPVIEPTR